MLKKFLIILLGIPFIVGANTKNNAIYTLNFDKQNQLEVLLSFEHSGENLSLVIPTEYGPVSGAENGITNLSIINKECDFIKYYEKLAPNQKFIEIDNCDRGKFKVSYNLKQVNNTIENASSNDHYLPVINERYTKILNAMALVVPWYKNKIFRSTIKINYTTNKATTFTNLTKVGSNEYKFEGSIVDFVKSFIYVTPENSKHRNIVESDMVMISIDRAFNSQGHTKKWSKIIKNTLESIALELGGPLRGKKLFAVLSELKSDHGSTSIDGLALTDMLWVQATTNQSPEEISLFLTHEILHTWLPNMFSNGNSVEADLQFFSEGFVEYMSLLVAMQEGIITRKKFNQKINQAVINLKHSEFAYMTMSKWLENYDRPPAWLGNRDLIYKVPYHKGMLLALKWDEELKQKGRTLFSVINRMLRDEVNLSVKNIEQTFSESGIADALGDVTDYIYNNQGPADFQSRYLHCQGTTTRPINVYYLGFENEDGKPISDIDKMSNAYLAGLREGMVIAFSQFAYGNPTIEVTLKTTDGHIFKFMPSKLIKEVTISDNLTIPLQKNCLPRSN